MSDETTTTTEETAAVAEAVPESAPAVSASTSAAAASETLVLGENLDHNRVTYAEGSQVHRSVFTAQEFDALRAAGILKFEHEVQKAEDVARQLADKAAALVGAQAEIAALRAQLEAAQKAGSKSR